MTTTHPVDNGAIDHLQDIFIRGKNLFDVAYIKHHDNYVAWLAAIEALGKENGIPTKPENGNSIGYIRALHRAGVCPQHINAIAALLFL